MFLKLSNPKEVEFRALVTCVTKNSDDLINFLNPELFGVHQDVF